MNQRDGGHNDKPAPTCLICQKVIDKEDERYCFGAETFYHRSCLDRNKEDKE